MHTTVVSKKGQVVIPKAIRDRLGLKPGTVLRVDTEGKKVILEPVEKPPKEIFVDAGTELTREILREAKSSSDKIIRFLKDLGVEVD
ncbi:AbrB family transcriptional regulator [Candidatus Geothermarchaeota archaeon]|nr:MAG: AbrB family transcriptional regulator [Candidatus Geothermarchaeota archaeon]HEW93794.1 AbrB/MazE/SpoVT family DNA-binding domain-containing protein [Thermoprotei archaeon]